MGYVYWYKSMISRIPACGRIGGSGGFFAGFFCHALTKTNPLGAALPPLAGVAATDFLTMGALVGLVFALFAWLVHVFFFRYDARSLLFVSVVVGVIVGAVCGSLSRLYTAYWISGLTGLMLGVLLGIVTCWLLCGWKRDLRVKPFADVSTKD